MNAHSRIQRYCCPTCGGDIGEAMSLDLVRDFVTQPSHRVIFDMLAKANGGFVSKEQIINRLYGHSSTGGPEVENNIVNQFLHRMRRQLAELGWHLQSARDPMSRNSRYRLIPLEAGA